MILTQNVLSHPWFVAEIYRALRAKRPIVTVAVDKFDFAAAAEWLHELDANLDEDAHRVLAKAMVDVKQAAALLSSSLPFIVAKPFSTTANTGVNSVQLASIADAVRALRGDGAAQATQGATTSAGKVVAAGF